jgi:hypothetical protein
VYSYSKERAKLEAAIAARAGGPKLTNIGGEVIDNASAGLLARATKGTKPGESGTTKR